MTAPGRSLEARRAELVARAAEDRELLTERLAPLAKVDRAVTWLRQLRPHLPAIAMGAGVGLSALLLAFPTRKFPLVRGGIALLQLVGSARKLFRRP